MTTAVSLYPGCAMSGVGTFSGRTQVRRFLRVRRSSESVKATSAE